MARFTYSGGIYDVSVAPDAADSGRVKLNPGASVQFYSVRTGGTPLTTYYLDSNEDDTYETTVSAITPDASSSYFPPFQVDDATVLWYQPPGGGKRVRITSREALGGSTAGTVTKVRGVLPDVNGDVTALTADNIPDGTTGKQFTATERTKLSGIATGATANSADATLLNRANHTGTQDALTTLTNLGGAVDPVFTHANHIGGISFSYDPATGQVSGVVASDTAPTANTLAMRGGGGTIETATPVSGTHAVNLDYFNANKGTGTGGTVDVRGLRLAPSTASIATPLSSSTNGTTPTDIPTLAVTDAQSGQVIRCAGFLAYRAVAAAGITVRIKTAGATVTNRLANGDFNADITGWIVQNNATGTYDTTTKLSGAGSLKVVVNASVTVATNVAIVSPWVPASAADSVFSSAVSALRGTATARNIRTDVQYGSDTVTDTTNGGTGVLDSYLGNSVASTTGGTWTRIISDSAHRSGTLIGAAAKSTGATKVRMRFTILSALAGDTFYFDQAQLEPSDPVPAYGNTGGGTASALTAVGHFTGHPGTGTGGTASNEVTVITYPATSTLGHSALGLGITTTAALRFSLDVVIGGTGLTNQRVEFEFLQAVANATATQIVGGHATFVKVPPAA